MTTDELAAEFADMAASLHDEPTFDETLDRVLEFALKAVDCTHAGVIFVHKKKGIETLGATDPLVAKLDAVQFEIGHGPDIDMLTDCFSVSVEDTATETRWPEWAAEVARAGLGSMIGTRLYTSATTIGSLNLYHLDAHHFSAADREVAHILARHAAIALDHAHDTENLWRAIDARKVIGQAQGILMERYGIDSDKAFEVLRRYSQDNNLKLHTVAQRLIESRTLPHQLD